MASRLIARRRQQLKKATTVVSKQSLELALQEGQQLVEELINIDANDGRLDQLEQALSFLDSILKKSPVDMQAEGAASLEDYLDDAVMPEMAAKIKADVDLVVNLKSEFAPNPNRNVEMTPTMASGSDNWVTNRDEEVKEASGENWVSDRIDGEPEEPVLAEVPRLASAKVTTELFYGKKKAAPPAPVPPAAPAKPSADITQLSSDTLAKMQKALAGSEDLMNDKAAQAFIAAIAEELMNRPVEVEQQEPAAPAAGAPPAPMPMAAALKGLSVVAFDDEDEGFEDEMPSCPACGGPGMLLGTLGRLTHFKCRNCGMEYSEGDTHTAAGQDRRKNPFADDMKRKQEAEKEEAAKVKSASNQGGSFVNDGETGSIVEDGGRTPEVAKAHAELEDNTGIKRPATELVTKFAGDDLTTGSALKKVEKAGEDLKALYLETKKVTKSLDSRPVREAIEAIYRAYDMMGEAAKVLNKQKMQEEAEEKAIEVKDKAKKSSLLDALILASEDEE